MTVRLVFVFAFAAALGSATALLPVGAFAQQADGDKPAMDEAGPMEGMGPAGHHMTPEDRQAFLDARIAAVHAGLKLSPDQEKLWPPVEGAIRDAFAEMREARQKNEAAAGGAEKPDPIARMRRMAARSMSVAQNLTKVADAAEPLYGALNDDQKWRLHALLRAMHLRGAHPGMGMMKQGGEGEGRQHEE
jgi:hypothetical protein